MGSLSTYWAMVWRMVDLSDVVVQVVDARFPSICRSNQLEKKLADLEDTGLLIALNKSDLIPKELLDKWIKWFCSIIRKWPTSSMTMTSKSSWWARLASMLVAFMVELMQRIGIAAGTAAKAAAAS